MTEDELTLPEKLQAHIVALEMVVSTALPMLLKRAEAEQLRAVIQGRTAVTPPPDGERPEAIWSRAGELAEILADEIVSRTLD